MKWLVTAFEPFAGARSNSSSILLDQMRTREFGGRVLFHSPLPVVFGAAWPALERIIVSHPELEGVLALGQAEGRAKISLERVALNWIDARTPDNAGVKPEIGPLLQGPDLLWSNIPWERFPLSNLCTRSYSAGTYVCNELMYRLAEWAEARGKMAGFVHVPLVESQSDACFAGMPRMADLDAAAELERIISFVIDL